MSIALPCLRCFRRIFGSGDNEKLAPLRNCHRSVTSDTRDTCRNDKCFATDSKCVAHEYQQGCALGADERLKQIKEVKDISVY